MTNIEEIYKHFCETPSDINEHLSVLRHYAENCDHVTEMGVRGIVSTFAFVSAKPKIIRAIDLYHPSNWNGEDRLNYIENYCKENNIDFRFILGDTLEIEIEPTDFLFIDTLHTYEQLKTELEKHGNKANKYIGFHDTTLFANEDEHNSYTNKIMTGNIKGLWPAIESFILNNPHWSVLERRTNNNGLTILERK